MLYCFIIYDFLILKRDKKAVDKWIDDEVRSMKAYMSRMGVNWKKQLDTRKCMLVSAQTIQAKQASYKYTSQGKAEEAKIKNPQNKTE